MNRKLFLILALVLSLALGLGTTLAYLTDTDGAVNVMTLGDVSIEQHEYERIENEDGSYSYSEVSSYSPLTYANNMLGKPTTKESLKTLLKTMLNYGAAAQL